MCSFRAPEKVEHKVVNFVNFDVEDAITGGIGDIEEFANFPNFFPRVFGDENEAGIGDDFDNKTHILSLQDIASTRTRRFQLEKKVFRVIVSWAVMIAKEEGEL